MNHLAGLFEVHTKRVQRLNFAHCITASQAAIALDNAIMILETPKLLCFTIAAMTRHLILSGVDLIVTVNLQDSVPQRFTPVGMRPGSVSALTGLCFIFTSHGYNMLSSKHVNINKIMLA